MVDTHLKVIDIQSHCLFDLLSEPNFDQDSVSGMGLVRSLADKSYRLFILCQNEEGNYFWWEACCFWNDAKCVPKGIYL